MTARARGRSVADVPGRVRSTTAWARPRGRIGELADVAVGNGVDGPVHGAHTRDAEGEVLDHAADRADRDAVADAVLVLEREEEAGEIVAHDELGAEAEGGADDRGAGQQRGRG